MKRKYLKPFTETVNVRLEGSVLEDPTLHDKSIIAGGGMDAKENLEFEFDDSFGDIWSDPNAGNDPYDLWGDN